MPNGSDVTDQMLDAGWTRVGEVEFSVDLLSWQDAREPLGAAMNAALAPLMPYWLGGFASAEAAAGVDRAGLEQMATIFDAWALESHPEWYRESADPLPFEAGSAESAERIGNAQTES
jgi:hypothetical protein